MAATDQLFKEALHEFFAEFVQLFFPRIADQIDFDQEIIFRDRELFTDFPGGAQREPDVVAEVRTLSGDPELIVFHAEVQAQRQREFGFRMWQYYSLLRFRTGMPVFPLAIYLTPGSGDSNWDQYTEALLGEELIRFRFPIVSLPELSAKDWLTRSGPAGALAAALASIMQPGDLSVARIKYDALIRAATEGVNEAQQVVLTTIVETFLPLDRPDDAAEFDRLVATRHAGQELEMLTSPYELRGIEKGLQQGMQQGIQQGIIAGQREMLLRLLRDRFVSVPEPLEKRVQELTRAEDITALFDRAMRAQSIEELVS